MRLTSRRTGTRKQYFCIAGVPILETNRRSTISLNRIDYCRKNALDFSVTSLITHVVEQVLLITFLDSQISTIHPTTSSRTKASTSCSGQLENGTPYVIYRVIFYCDDFTPSTTLYPEGSAGGCYMLPVGLPPEARRSNSSIWVISLTPPVFLQMKCFTSSSMIS